MDTTSLLWNVFGVFFLAWIIKWTIKSWKSRLPPGPWGLPLLGYSPFLSAIPYDDYKRLGKKYGDIFGFRIGTQYMVVLNNFTDIKEAFNKNEFLDRPPDWFKMHDDSDHILNQTGKDWKETRRFTMSTLRNLGMGKSRAEEIIQEEIQKLLEKFGRLEPNTEINIFDITIETFLNIILTLLCGRTYQEGEELLNANKEYHEDFLKRFIINQRKVYYPFLRPYLGILEAFKLNLKTTLVGMQQFIKDEIDKHENGSIDYGTEDYISYYLNQMKENSGKPSAINRANFLANTEILMFAGTDTSRTTTAWIFLYLAKYQEAQEKIYQEIVNIYGKETPPYLNERNQLPYTEAFIAESSRFNSIVPADDPHWASEDGTIGDFSIPKDTIVLANVKAVHNDKKLWGDPENFRPERFLSLDGKSTLIPEYWIPFLTGKRACPGTKLANMELFLFLTSIVQKFKVLPPRSGLDVEEVYKLIVYPKKPVISLKKRE